MILMLCSDTSLKSAPRQCWLVPCVIPRAREHASIFPDTPIHARVQRHPVHVPLLLLDVVLLYEHKDHGATPEQDADPAPSHARLNQTIGKDSLVPWIISEEILLVPVTKEVRISVHMVIMERLVYDRVGEDGPKIRKDDDKLGLSCAKLRLNWASLLLNLSFIVSHIINVSR